jgi:hypothetical protein
VQNSPLASGWIIEFEHTESTCHQAGHQAAYAYIISFGINSSGREWVAIFDYILSPIAWYNYMYSCELVLWEHICRRFVARSMEHTNRRCATNNRPLHWLVFKDSELWDFWKKISELYFPIRNYGTYFFGIYPDSELWDLFFGVIRLSWTFLFHPYWLPGTASYNETLSAVTNSATHTERALGRSEDCWKLSMFSKTKLFYINCDL